MAKEEGVAFRLGPLADAGDKGTDPCGHSVPMPCPLPL